MKTNEIAVARKAIRTALKSGKIARDTSAMHRVGMDAIEGMQNPAVVNELAWQAVKDVYFA